jgi:hypothetical protein
MTASICRIYNIRERQAALSRELNLAARNLEVPVLAHAAVAARHVWNASSRRTARMVACYSLRSR